MAPEGPSSPASPDDSGADPARGEEPNSSPQPEEPANAAALGAGDRGAMEGEHSAALPEPAVSTGDERVPAYEVAARMLAQGVLAGVSGGLPLTVFLFGAMVMDGVSLPEPHYLVGSYLFFTALVSAWGAALTAVEEFARRAERSVGRMVAASLGFPVFAIFVAAWIGGVIDGGAAGAVKAVQMVGRELFREFVRSPFLGLAVGAAFLVPFLGLLLLRRRLESDWGGLLGSYYLPSAGFGLFGAGCILSVNLAGGGRVRLGAIFFALTAGASLVAAAAWGLARGRAISDRYVQRYRAWARAD